MRPSRLFRAVLTAAAASALALAPALAAQAGLATSWHVVFTKHYGAAANFSGYTAAVTLSKTDAWVFGSTSIAGFPAPGTPVAVHWNGTAWQTSTLPSGLRSEINAASAISANDVWAITETGADVLHWNGTQWSVAEQVPGSRGSLLTGIVAFSDSDVWVFGAAGAGPGLGTWHFDGTTWAKVTGPGGSIGIASALSATDMWGLGPAVSGTGGEVVHYNGSAWQPVTASAFKGVGLQDILALSDNDIWVTATVLRNSSKTMLVWDNNGTWTQVKLPWPVGNLGWLAPDGQGGFWLDATATSSSKSWIVHRTAAGSWSRTSTPGFMTQLALIPGTASLWAAGWADTAGGNDANAQIWAHGPAA